MGEWEQARALGLGFIPGTMQSQTCYFREQRGQVEKPKVTNGVNVVGMQFIFRQKSKLKTKDLG